MVLLELKNTLDCFRAYQNIFLLFMAHISFILILLGWLIYLTALNKNAFRDQQIIKAILMLVIYLFSNV